MYARRKPRPLWARAFTANRGTNPLVRRYAGLMADGVSPLSLDAASNTRIARVTVNWNLYAGHRYPRSIFISVTPSSPALMIHRLPLSFPFPGNWTREGHSGLLGYRLFFHFWIWRPFFGKFWIGGFSEDLKTGIWNWLYAFMNDSSFWLVGFGNKGNNALVVRNWTSNFRRENDEIFRKIYQRSLRL